jgi:prepilin-type N-terminal cleavage/methylation domain-containing protein
MVTSHNKGFTIIELIIVIVIIGIVTGITVVAYNGTQVRARNVVTAETVQTYVDALVYYHSKNGKYPDANGTNKTCLGLGYTGGTCWLGGVNENAAFMNQLATAAGNFTGKPANTNLALNGAYFNPVRPSYPDNLDGVPENFVVYSIENGSNKCPIGPVASDDADGNVQTLISTPPANGRTFTSGDNKLAQCWIPLSLIK